MIDNDTVLGKGVRIFDANLVNIYGCTIGEDTFIGPFVEITRGVEIGKRCKIESHSFLCDGVTLEDDVFIGHGVVFANDLYPKVNRQIVRARCKVGAFASIGSNATIIGDIQLGEYCVVGGGAVVVHDVPAYAIVAGNPARIIRQFSSEEEILAYMSKRQALREDEEHA